MAISYPRALPTEMLFESASLQTNSIVAVAKSIFTAQEQVQAHQGQFWSADLTTTPVERSDAGPIMAWLASMNGREKTFLFGDPAAKSPRGSADSAPGTPLVNGASQTGAALICDGAPNSATGYLKEGDYIQLGSGSTATLHMVLADVNSDGSGNFTLDIWPNLRASPATNAAVVVENAVGLFRLAANSSKWDENTIIYGFSFSIVEALPIT